MPDSEIYGPAEPSIEEQIEHVEDMCRKLTNQVSRQRPWIRTSEEEPPSQHAVLGVWKDSHYPEIKWMHVCWLGTKGGTWYLSTSNKIDAPDWWAELPVMPE